MADDKLTLKQEAFCQAYIETGNASEAYRRAYDASGMADNVIHVKACELLKNGKVAVRLEAMQRKSAARHEITVEKLTEMAVAAYDLAMKEEVSAPAAAVAAVMALGKMHGFVIDKKQVTADLKHHNASEPVSDTHRWASEVLGSTKARKASEPLPN